MLGRHEPVQIEVPKIVSVAGSGMSAVDSPLEKQRLDLQARQIELQERKLELATLAAERKEAEAHGRTDAMKELEAKIDRLQQPLSPSTEQSDLALREPEFLPATPVPETFEAQQTAYATGSAREAIRMLDAIRSTPTTDLVRQADKIHKLDATARKALALEEHKPAVIVNVGLLSAIADRTLNKLQAVEVEQIADSVDG